jgi:chromosome partitioning protein
MKIVCVATEKGGVGKTTLCAYLAWYFSTSGKRVLAIDLDQQGNLGHTLGAETNTASPTALDLFEPMTAIPPLPSPITLIKSDPDLLDIEQTRDESVPTAFRQNVVAASQNFDLCVIDTPPSLGVRVVAGLISSDYSVAPIDMGEYSLIGIQRVMDFQGQVAAHFGMDPPEFLGILPSRYDTRSPRERAIYEQLVNESESIPLFPHYVTKRDAYARSSTEKIPAWEMSGTAAREAAAEMRVVMREFERRLFG